MISSADGHKLRRMIIPQNYDAMRFSDANHWLPRQASLQIIPMGFLLSLLKLPGTYFENVLTLLQNQKWTMTKERP